MALVGSDGGNSRLVNFAGKLLEHCESHWAFGKTPHVLIAGASAASMFNEEVQADLLFLGDTIAMRAMDMFPKYSLLLQVQPEYPQEVWGVFVAVG